MSIPLLRAIAEVESANDPNAYRFEPALFRDRPNWIINSLAAIKSHNSVSHESSIAIACASWGRYQLLGANIYAHGFAGPILSYATANQEHIAGAFIHTIGFHPGADMASLSAHDLIKFATRYNGPGNAQGYAARLRQAANRLA